MRRPKGYVAAMACLMLCGGVAAAGAEETGEASRDDGGEGSLEESTEASLEDGDAVFLEGGVPEPLEVHVWTPPKQQLEGPDIVVDTWTPEQDRSSEIDYNEWVPGEPSQIRVIDARSGDPSRIRVDRWSPRARSDSDLVVHRWRPGQPSRIRVHGGY